MLKSNKASHLEFPSNRVKLLKKGFSKRLFLSNIKYLWLFLTPRALPSARLDSIHNVVHEIVISPSRNYTEELNLYFEKNSIEHRKVKITIRKFWWIFWKLRVKFATRPNNILLKNNKGSHLEFPFNRAICLKSTF